MSKKQNKSARGDEKQPARKQYSPVVLAVMFLLFLAAVLALVILNAKVKDGGLTLPSASETPAATPEPSYYVSPGEYEETYNSEFESESMREIDSIKATGSYANAQISCELHQSIELYLGADVGVSDDGIYLNPCLIYGNAANSEEPYLFLIRASRGDLDYLGEPAAYGSGKNTGKQYFYLAGRTYDKLVPATYYSASDYGVKWKNNVIADGKDKTGCELTIHAIRLADGFLMGAARAKIVYDSSADQYKISSLTPSDVSVTGELPGDLRDQIVAEAIRYINSDDRRNISLKITEQEYNNNERFIVVEKLSGFLFSRFYDYDEEVAPAGRYAACEPYAVNIPCTGFGYLTVYFAPRARVYGFMDVNISDPATMDLIVVGYDAIKPDSAEIFNSFLVPEDRDKFNVS